MGMTFMRSMKEPQVWISLPFSEDMKKDNRDAVSQHLYNHQIKATMSTIVSDHGASIKLRFPTEEDEALFMMYIGILCPPEEEQF